MQDIGCWNASILLTAALGAMLLWGTPSTAQEIASIDLTHTDESELRRPPQQSGDSNAVHGGGREIHECAQRGKGAGAVRTTLVSVDRTDYKDGDDITFEVRVENTGSAPIRLPISAHLADVQPANAPYKFRYSEMEVKVWIGGHTWSADTGGRVTLYGAADHAGTTVLLKPGEWLRIVGTGTITMPHYAEQDVLRSINAGDIVREANATVSVYNDEIALTATATATVATGVCLNQSQGQELAIRMLPN